MAEGLLPAEGKLYYRIGEVSRITGVKPYVLRYWESEFRWMAPQKSRSQQRLYRRKDIEMILLIQRLLHDERYTIAGARKRLRELGIGRALEQAAEGVRAESVSQDVPSTRQMCKNIRRELVAIRAML
jgi:DNA-binding transcriptional MerR regulator